MNQSLPQTTINNMSQWLLPWMGDWYLISNYLSVSM